MAVKKASESKASQEEVNWAAAKSEVTQLQLRATKELELELRAKPDHDKTVAKTAEAEERAIQEKFLVSKTSEILVRSSGVPANEGFFLQFFP